jgi:electron transport complex protein RnfG
MEKAESKNQVFISGWVLALTALVGTGLMAGVNWHSQPYIAENERQMLIRSLNTVIPPQSYDNDILHDTTTVNDPGLLGSKQASLVYRARKGSEPIAAALTVIAPNGYSGPITLLVGIDYNGEITGVRVVNHHETPGLGDGIEKRRSNWIDAFTGKSASNPGEAGWKVKRDGGNFDQFTGATITPRAVVGAVHKALIFFSQNRAALFGDDQPGAVVEKSMSVN